MIVYACICRATDGIILTQFKETGGNSEEVMQALVNRLIEIPDIVPPGSRKTFSQQGSADGGDFLTELFTSCTGGYVSMDENEHFFHIYRSSTLFLTCISDQDDYKTQVLNFEFLQTLETEFTNEFSNRQISRAKRLGLQKKFGPNIRSKLHYYNTNQTKLCRDQKIQIMLEKVEKVQTIMDRKIRLLIERQEGQLNDMLEKSSNMKEDASVFKKRAETLNQWSEQQKIVYHCGLAGLVFAFVYLVLGLACGFTLQDCLA